MRRVLVAACCVALVACSSDSGSGGTGVGDAGVDRDVFLDNPNDAGTKPDGAPLDAEDDTPPIPDAFADIEEDPKGDAEDAEPDVPEGPTCGDGVLDEGEACDDGNTRDDDECSSACEIAMCGDGLTNVSDGLRTIYAPEVRNPFGSGGFVCDDGASCPEAGCRVADDPFAPEHGICQALGYERAEEVVWGFGQGAGTVPAVRALNWDCADYICEGSDFNDVSTPCEDYEMLNRITCRGTLLEACDDGVRNGFEPDACRPDCTAPVCGDGVVDSDEECDDRNYEDDDECRTTCEAARCGDLIVDEVLGEVCDDGDDDPDDACGNDCQPGPLYRECGDLDIENRYGAYSGDTTDGESRFLASPSPDYAFVVRPEADGVLRATTCGFTTWNTAIYIFDVTTGCATRRFMAFDDNDCGEQSLVSVNARAGRSYLVVIEGSGELDTGPFTVAITGP